MDEALFGNSQSSHVLRWVIVSWLVSWAWCWGKGRIWSETSNVSFLYNSLSALKSYLGSCKKNIQSQCWAPRQVRWAWSMVGGLTGRGMLFLLLMLFYVLNSNKHVSLSFSTHAVLVFEKNEVIFLITFDVKSKSSVNPYSFCFFKENHQFTQNLVS